MQMSYTHTQLQAKFFDAHPATHHNTRPPTDDTRRRNLAKDLPYTMDIGRARNSEWARMLAFGTAFEVKDYSSRQEASLESITGYLGSPKHRVFHRMAASAAAIEGKLLCPW